MNALMPCATTLSWFVRNLGIVTEAGHRRIQREDSTPKRQLESVEVVKVVKRTLRKCDEMRAHEAVKRAHET